MMGNAMLQFHEWDILILRWLQQNRIEHWDVFLTNLSYVTSFVSIAVMLAVLLWSFKTRSKALRFQFFQLVLAVTTVAIFTFLLKLLISRQRPFITYADVEKLSEGGSHSFPSGHTAEAFALATAIFYLFKNRALSLVAFSWAIVVAYSRMALGVHYPSDVLGGAIVGCAVSFLMLKLSMPKNAQRG